MVLVVALVIMYANERRRSAAPSVSFVPRYYLWSIKRPGNERNSCKVEAMEKAETKSKAAVYIPCGTACTM